MYMSDDDCKIAILAHQADLARCPGNSPFTTPVNTDVSARIHDESNLLLQSCQNPVAFQL